MDSNNNTRCICFGSQQSPNQSDNTTDEKADSSADHKLHSYQHDTSLNDNRRCNTCGQLWDGVKQPTMDTGLKITELPVVPISNSNKDNKDKKEVKVLTIEVKDVLKSPKTVTKQDSDLCQRSLSSSVIDDYNPVVRTGNANEYAISEEHIVDQEADDDTKEWVDVNNTNPGNVIV